ncbi:hypothetical protein BKA93DRAFT_925267 [Sparassis latifolia]|uniref:Uncharacterized protein n=1 Tax=Sparassis crispa TaxID=139825 RepID=A0A401H5H9_9APHY|nr:hypothetical protein SCP_1603150 [Sparassis crispa]GBE89651.1 hypothetical protein SCP_1603150 [Sparassis crispa]
MDDPFPPRRRLGKPATAGADSRDHRFFGLSVDSPGASGSSARNTASRIVNSVKRSFSVQRRRDMSPVDRGMYSTPEESIPHTPSRYNFSDAPDTRPTIEQIAMGLHISRTPHLRPVHITSQLSHLHSRHHDGSDDSHVSYGYSPAPRPNGHHRRNSASVLLTPARSSLKKRPSALLVHSAPASAPLTPTTSDLSLSTLTSNGPSTPRSSRSPSVHIIPSRLQLSMSRLLPGKKSSVSRASSPAVTTNSSDDDAGSAELVSRKVVRFSPGVHKDHDVQSS